MPRRITLVLPTFGRGGAERVMCTMANFWATHGHDVALVTIASEEMDSYTLHEGVRRIALDRLGSSNHVAEALKTNLNRIRLLRRTLLEERPDVVVSFIDTTNVLTLLATIGTRVPIIVSERTDPAHHSIGLAWELARRLVYRRAAALVTQSPEVERWAAAFVAPHRTIRIANPLTPLATGEHESARREGRGGRPCIIAMGRLSPEKGFDLLIRALARVRQRHPEACLEIVGEGSERASLEDLARELGVGDAVRMPGYSHRPMDNLSRGDLFVLSSYYEGFPNALVEAMACGLPVIATDCPSGPRQIVRPGVDGVLVPVGDVSALAEAISALLADAPARARLAERATEVRSRFSVPRVMSQWEGLVQRVIEENAPRRVPELGARASGVN